MNSPDPPSSDPHLRDLLRETHPAPSLPPRFQEAVWQRVEQSARTAMEAPRSFSGLEAWIRSWFRPAYLAAGLTLAVLGGAWLGFHRAEIRFRGAEQARYVASVDPFHRTFP